ncbi:hypothetical protein EHZ18_29830, partial [Burkholderia vietnamiensis]
MPRHVALQRNADSPAVKIAPERTDEPTVPARLARLGSARLSSLSWLGLAWLGLAWLGWAGLG